MISTGQKIATERVRVSRLATTDLEKVTFGRTFSDHMFVMDHRDGGWREPRIVPYDDLRMSPASAVLHYAQSIFEGLKAYRAPDGKVNIFRPQENIARMNRSAERMCMPTLPEGVFMEALTELVALDQDWIPKGDDAALYIRPFMMAADTYIGIRPSDTYTFIIFTCPVRSYYAEPVNVEIETRFSRAFPGGTGEAKCAGNYGAALYPLKEANARGIHQMIWTDALEHKYIEESGTMNVFFRIDDTLVTPETGGTILRGVTRDSIITLARDMNVPLEVRRVTVDEVVDAARNGRLKEAFGAGTAATIAHIRSITHQDEVYTLPPVEERQVSRSIGDRLDNIRRGREADPFGWLVPVG
ncbi:MAG: branched-chain amino acid aminotransferase [Flavobacteriales bacterium]|jgi:branched-chain amino acid aminotransferase|nr:branched-chain amino acid aminotransferase [Flavobacteriales bacterium]